MPATRKSVEVRQLEDLDPRLLVVLEPYLDASVPALERDQLPDDLMPTLVELDEPSLSEPPLHVVQFVGG